MSLVWGEPTGQGWTQVLELTEALVLAAVIGLEREFHQKSAGLRTHTLIGFAAALIVLVSKYGFGDVLSEHVVLDPSRVAAQIVSGIGFLGGGLIFVKRDIVRGLTTAAAVWLTTAVGMAAGAGLPILAAAATAGYLLVLYALPPLARRAHRTHPYTHHIEVTYQDGRGLLRDILNLCTSRGWVVAQLTTRPGRSHLPAGSRTANLNRRDSAGNDDDARAEPGELVSVLIGMRGTAPYTILATDIEELDGVYAVTATDPDGDPDDERDTGTQL